MTAGRPTEYKKEYNDQAMKMCLLGATDIELAEFFEVSETTLNNWKRQHPKFLVSIKEGKEVADSKVAESLYNQAKEGNTTAQIFWLKNRRKKHWRDKQEHELSGQDGKPIETITRTIIDPVKS